jgi:hypothetical protein
VKAHLTLVLGILFVGCSKPKVTFDPPQTIEEFETLLVELLAEGHGERAMDLVYSEGMDTEILEPNVTRLRQIWGEIRGI